MCLEVVSLLEVQLREPLTTQTSCPSTTSSHWFIDHLELPRARTKPLSPASVLLYFEFDLNHSLEPSHCLQIIFPELYPPTSSNCLGLNHFVEALCFSLEDDVKRKDRSELERSIEQAESKKIRRKEVELTWGGSSSPCSSHWLLKPLGCGLLELLPSRDN